MHPTMEYQNMGGKNWEIEGQIDQSTIIGGDFSIF